MRVRTCPYKTTQFLESSLGTAVFSVLGRGDGSYGPNGSNGPNESLLLGEEVVFFATPITPSPNAQKPNNLAKFQRACAVAKLTFGNTGGLSHIEKKVC